METSLFMFVLGGECQLRTDSHELNNTHSSDEDEATQLLIDHGANLNSLNKKGATPLIIAAVKGHHSVLRILANHPQIQLHQQVSSTYNGYAWMNHSPLPLLPPSLYRTTVVTQLSTVLCWHRRMNQSPSYWMLVLTQLC